MRKVWKKINQRLEVRDDALVKVRYFTSNTSEGRKYRETVTPCGDRVTFDGRVLSSRAVLHYLTTGEWPSRTAKLERFRAVVRCGKKTKHLGYFATREERDAAVFAWRLGVRENT